MNTNKSKLFTNKAMAKKVADARNNGKLYLLGKDDKERDTWYVGTYDAAMKASRRYNQ